MLLSIRDRILQLKFKCSEVQLKLYILSKAFQIATGKPYNQIVIADHDIMHDYNDINTSTVMAT